MVAAVSGTAVPVAPPIVPRQQVVEGGETKTVKPVKKPAGSTWGTKTQDAIKKAGSDFNKTVKSIFGGKSESTKPESTTTPAATETTGGGAADGGTDGDNKSDNTDK